MMMQRTTNVNAACELTICCSFLTWFGHDFPAGQFVSRGGWPRAELHYGSISQYASFYTISHAVRSSGEATEDPLKSEFLASFDVNAER